MADLMSRPNGAGRGLVSDLFGFDPLRGFAGNVATYGSGEVQKTNDGWIVELPVPGYKPDEIEVTVEDRVLTVNGKSERRSFQRSIILSDDIDVDAIEAKVEHGMLNLGLHVHPKAQPRKIAISVGGSPAG
ncbi:MAG: heat-shock protein Hsp20 [Candidatus Eremiobacteraeota bacterium]|jgi:HSP20 family molecular chaperone IbpA|nr:heat-shock protein Hsp20 [Candidatus Eremiobacteraeota bacterium]